MQIKKYWTFVICIFISYSIFFPLSCLAKSKENVLISRPFTSQKDISSFIFCFGGPIPGKIVYDPELNGTKILISPDNDDGTVQPLCQLRNDNKGVSAPKSGILRIEYEIFMPSSFINLPFQNMPWYTMKTFRVFNNKKRITKKKTVLTVTFVSSSKEFRIRSMGKDKKLGWLPDPDTWTKISIILDQDNQTLRVIASDGFDSGVISDDVKITPVDNIAPVLHSTSRSHHGSGKHPETFLAYRNVRLIHIKVSDIEN